MMVQTWLVASLLAGCGIDSSAPDQPSSGTRQPVIPQPNSHRDPDPTLTLPMDTEAHPAVAFNGSEYLVVWNDQLGIYGARVSTTGALIDSEAFVIVDAPFTYMPKAMRDRLRPAVASNGSDFFVAWSIPIDDKTDRYAGRTITAAGDLLPIVPIASPGPAAAALYTAPAVASKGMDYLVVWDEPDPAAPTQRDIVTAPIVNGVLGATRVIGHDTQGSTLSAASNGDSYLIAWDLMVDWTGPDDEYVRWNIKGVRMTDASVEEVAGLGPPEKYWFGPSVTSNGSDYFVAWSEFYFVTLSPNYDSEYDTRATRVSGTGILQDSATIAVSAPPFSVQPVVAANSDLYVALVTDVSGVAAARISDGVVQDPSAIRITSDSKHYLSAAVSSDGTSFLAAWAVDRYDAYYSTDMYMTLIAADGTVGPIITTPPVPR